MRLFFVLILFSQIAAFADEEQAAKDRILNQFANKEAYLAKEKLEAQAKEKQAEEEKLSAEEKRQRAQQALEDFNNAQLAQAEAGTQEQPKSMDADDTADLEELSSGKFSMPSMGEMPKIDPAEMQKIMQNIEGNPLFKMMDKKQKEAAAMMMKHNPFQNMKRDAIKSSILGAMDANKPAGKFLHNNPKLVDIIADIGVDKDAIPAFISIMNEPGKMKTFGMIVLGVFIAVFILNLKNSKSNILKRLFFKLSLMIGASCVNLGAFYFIFKDQLQPTLNIVFKYI